MLDTGAAISSARVRVAPCAALPQAGCWVTACGQSNGRREPTNVGRRLLDVPFNTRGPVNQYWAVAYQSLAGLALLQLRRPLTSLRRSLLSPACRQLQGGLRERRCATSGSPPWTTTASSPPRPPFYPPTTRLLRPDRVGRRASARRPQTTALGVGRWKWFP